MYVTEDGQLIQTSVSDLMISSEKVAHVQTSNFLDHALLVLVKSGYSAVPVLDVEYRLVGIISKTKIIDKVLGLERFEVERLSEIKVCEVMEDDVFKLKETDLFLEGLKRVIDSPFICVSDEDDYFKGILTRRAILKEVQRNYYTSKEKHNKSENGKY